MRLRSRDLFQTAHTEGGLLPADLLARIADGDGDLGGLRPTDYHLAPGERLGEQITRSWTRLADAWQGFDEARAGLPIGDPGARLTRERWLHVLFNELGYGRLVQQPAIEIEGKAFPVFSQWQHTPIHLVGCGTAIDTRTKGVRGATGQSPHSLVQELLNRSPGRLWGILSNGLVLRLLRDNVALTRQAYLEFDLEAMFTGEIYADFVLLWLVCHQSRIEAEQPEDCWLERWTRAAAHDGTRALDALCQGVQAAIETLGAGFLAHPANRDLHQALREGDVDGPDYYRALLRLVYRLLFLFVAEDRDALLNPQAAPLARERYLTHYSTRQLRALAARRRGGRQHDRYEQLKLVMAALDRDGCPLLALPALGSYLWSSEAIGLLANAKLANNDLLDTVRSLSTVESGGVRRTVDFRNLGAEELGSVYESLLELHPTLDRATASFTLDAVDGSDRKTTGSYYTPTSLISTLLDSALEPVLDKAAAAVNSEAAILDLAIVDPASGSGHFLIAAANRIAKRLAAIRTGDAEPAPEALRAAVRDVVGACIYGVDVNPMAVELCKVSLWMEALEPGRPLSFLDDRIVCGNSLLGATPDSIAGGIPPDAFSPITGDDKTVLAGLRKRNARELKGQMAIHIADATAETDLDALARRSADIAAVDDHDLVGIRERQRRYHDLLDSQELQRSRLAADLWCAAFVTEKRPGAAAITQETLLRSLEVGGELSNEEHRLVAAARQTYAFLHWHVAFPAVWKRGGFDAVLGNPPWDRPKPEAAKYFAATHPELANASTAAVRAQLLADLATVDPMAHAAWTRYERRVLGSVAFLVRSGLYVLTATGKFNLGNTFLELALRLLSDRGFAGLLNISGIATDDSGKEFISHVMQTQRLVSLFDFENRGGLFPGVHRSYRFSAITLAGTQTGQSADFVFFAHRLEDLADHYRHVRFTAADVRLLNPISRNCPIFRNAREGELVKTIYVKAGLRGPEAKVLFEWDVEPTFLFVMSDHSHLFSTAPQLGLGTQPTFDWICPSSNGSRYLPLYEAKMVNQFDHRWASINTDGEQVDFSDEERVDPTHVAVPRYWMKEADALVKLSVLPKRWLIAVREVARATDERTTIAAVIPKYPVGHNAQVFSVRESGPAAACLLANLNSYCLDFAARTKVGGAHLSSFILRQLPILPRRLFEGPCCWAADQTLENWILPRVLELTFTAVDLTDFARDCGYDGPPFRWDPERRALIRAELDAAMFRLYRIGRDDVEYVMESFPIVKRNDERRFGEYRTKRLILDCYDAMAAADAAGQVYETPLHPPPAGPPAAHSTRALAKSA